MELFCLIILNYPISLKRQNRSVLQVFPEREMGNRSPLRGYFYFTESMIFDRIRVCFQTMSWTGDSWDLNPEIIKIVQCTDASPAFITGWREVILYLSRIASFMRKLNRVLATCENCGIIFSIDTSEYFIWPKNREKPSAFHSRECMIAYRETHKAANAMKKRILDLNRQGK